MIDLKVENNDLILENGDFKLDEGFDALLEILFLSDERANFDEIKIAELQRGTIGKEDIGSRLWLKEKDRLNSDTLEDLELYCKEICRRLINRGLINDYDINTTLISGGVKFDIILLYKDNTTNKFSFNWSNTGG